MQAKPERSKALRRGTHHSHSVEASVSQVELPVTSEIAEGCLGISTAVVEG
jgi:hypothetical protein